MALASSMLFRDVTHGLRLHFWMPALQIAAKGVIIDKVAIGN